MDKNKLDILLFCVVEHECVPVSFLYTVTCVCVCIHTLFISVLAVTIKAFSTN